MGVCVCEQMGGGWGGGGLVANRWYCRCCEQPPKCRAHRRTGPHKVRAAQRTDRRCGEQPPPGRPRNSKPLNDVKWSNFLVGCGLSWSGDSRRTKRGPPQKHTTKPARAPRSGPAPRRPPPPPPQRPPAAPAHSTSGRPSRPPGREARRTRGGSGDGWTGRGRRPQPRLTAPATPLRVTAAPRYLGSPTAGGRAPPGTQRAS